MNQTRKELKAEFNKAKETLQSRFNEAVADAQKYGTTYDVQRVNTLGEPLGRATSAKPTLMRGDIVSSMRYVNNRSASTNTILRAVKNSEEDQKAIEDFVNAKKKYEATLKK